MALPLDDRCRFGFMTGFSGVDQAREIVGLARSAGYDSLCVGDHIAFPVPIVDPLTQLSVFAGLDDQIELMTGVFLLPLRHPVPVAKQVGSLDLISRGRLIFGVGIGGEFPGEYAACEVPVTQRGARLGEGIRILEQLWTGETVRFEGRHHSIPDVRMLPRPHTPGGPPIWCGGRSPAALRRCGELADGWLSYVVTPQMYADGLDRIEAAAAAAGRSIDAFGTGHLLFTRLDESHELALDTATEHLSRRYGMDFREPARKYAALGTPQDVAARISAFIDAGVRHFVLDMVGPDEDRALQLEWFAADVMPLLRT